MSRAVGSSVLEREIRSQPAMLETRGSKGPEAASVVAHLGAHRVDHLVLAARGSSDNAARFGQYLLARRGRILTSLAAPSLFNVAETAPRLGNAGVVGLSQSGQSPDIVSVLTAARLQGRPTVTITNDENSPLARVGDVILPLASGKERAIAATRTYLASLVAFAELADAFDPSGAVAWAPSLPSLVDETIERAFAARRAVKLLELFPSLTVVGRGLGYSAAMEAALELREVTGVLGDAWSAPDLMHGPIAGLHHQSAAILITTPDFDSEYWRKIAEQLSSRSSTLLVVGDDADVGSMAHAHIDLPVGPAAWISSALAAVVSQVLAVLLGEVRGVDIDRPVGLSKVTLTS